MIAWIVGGLIVGLVVLYLVNPPIRRMDLSAARFLRQLPEPPRSRRLRLSPRRLVTSPLFWLQLLVLALLLAALLAWQSAAAADIGPRQIGVLLAFDTSASMTTLQNGTSRIDTAKLAAIEGLAISLDASQGGSWCARLAVFDLEWRELASTSDPAAATFAVSSLAARPLGSDLEIVRRSIVTLASEQVSACPITHVLVVTDRPEPSWRVESPLPIIWRDVGIPVSSVGITAITPIRNQLTGEVAEVHIQISAFGPAPTVSKLTIRSPSGQVREVPYTWGETRIWEDRFAPAEAGEYTLSLLPDGAYAYDDSATIAISATEPIRLDWRLAEEGVRDRLGWAQDAQRPLVRVVALADLAAGASQPTVPLLVVGPGYRPIADQRQPIGDFDEASTVLNDVNLDVAEQAGIQGLAALPDGFLPVLSGEDQKIWIAARAEPPAVYVPGLPIFDDDNLSALSQTIFFNALRELLGQRTFPPLYSLTSSAAPEPAGTRLALHPGEGDTSGEPRSAGELGDWRTGAASTDHDRLWPPLLAAALLAMALERSVAFLRGQRWS